MGSVPETELALKQPFQFRMYQLGGKKIELNGLPASVAIPV